MKKLYHPNDPTVKATSRKVQDTELPISFLKIHSEIGMDSQEL